MNKQLLYALGMLCIAPISFGQHNEGPKSGTKIESPLLNQLNHESIRRLSGSANRETINGWVSFEQTEYNYTYGPELFYTYGQVITPDSLARVVFTDGTYSSFTQGFGQLFDPTAEDMQYSDSRLTSADAYTIDSIGFPCIYRRVNHNGIDDTLVITIAVTDKATGEENPYAGNFWWSPSGLLLQDTYVLSPSYAGNPADGYHYGLTGVNDPGNNVSIQKLKFALTAADTAIFWRSFPVSISADPDQVVYTYVEYKPSFTTSITDTAFVFDGGVGEANTNSFRTIYDYPASPATGYFFDLYREDGQSYNASYVCPSDLRYGAYTGDNAWRNDYMDVYSWWGFRFEYYMNANSSVALEEQVAENDMFSIYPNPAVHGDQLTINFNEAKTGQLTIEDLNGRIVFSTMLVNESSIAINSGQLELAKGIYIVGFDSGMTKQTEKLVIQ